MYFTSKVTRFGLFSGAMLFVLFTLVLVGSPKVRSSPPSQISTASSVIYGNPTNYLTLLRSLNPGETLFLAPGIYRGTQNGSGLPIFHLKGVAGKPILISGPESGPRPVFYASVTRNTIRIADASYVTIRNLDLDGRNLDVDGVKAEGISDHITLENLCIKNHGNNQQTVGISTKAPAWDWVIRRNVILGAGTGIYLGDSDGTKPFIHGLIEYNLIRDTLGYNIEIKHQLPRPAIPEMPTAAGATIIRHNVFSKAENGSMSGMARPNLLVGHFPLSGDGSEDIYEIYGNFFYENPTGEPLFQGEGNLAIYNNLFWNDRGDAILVRPHNAYPRRVTIFWNTVVSHGMGIKVVDGSDEYKQRVIGNLAFGSPPILSNDQQDNLVGSPASAKSYLQHPELPLSKLDLSPLPGKLIVPNIDRSQLAVFDDALFDFDYAKRQGTLVGAYEGRRNVVRWQLVLETKPLAGQSSSVPFTCSPD
jgi:Right handed beta helix region